MIFFTPIKILILAAVIPALLLLIYVYKMDKLEKESPLLLLKLVFFGIISTLLASIGEYIGEFLLNLFFYYDTIFYKFLLYFVVIGGAEECSKYFIMKKITWNNPEFNCRFDGIVYATFVSLGFALWENIRYVLSYGFGTALLRAITAVPGHACFGVFMGFWYGMARHYENYGYSIRSRIFRILSVLTPMVIHGAYDYIATDASEDAAMIFFTFIICMFLICFETVKKLSKNDHYIE